MSNNRTIAKNTIFLYFRMIITMLISLYTSRVILQVLGIDDFGLYGAVAGVVGMLIFLNAALSTGTSRFLTFELGTGDFEKLKKTFSTLLNVHIILAIIIVILSETVGLWFVYHKLSIPADRMDAALWTYHISIFATFVLVMQVPFSASVISHEKMNIFAYASIVDVVLKLCIVYLLSVGKMDKLILYAALMCVVSIGMGIFYMLYCFSHFKETRYQFTFDKNIFKSVAGFSAWSLISGLAIALNTQGTVILTNIFFGPAVVTARAISVQVSSAANQFVSSFRTAVNPQIVKQYAAEDYDESKKLLLYSTKFSFFLMLLLGLPIILLAEPILQLWLGQFPEYTVIFVQLIIIQSLFSVFDTSFYTALFTKGRLRENALISPLLGFIQFPIIYLLFKKGYSPVVLSYAGIIVYAMLGLIIKPVLICKIVNYTFRDITSVFIPCLKVCLLAVPIPVLVSYYLANSLINYFAVCVVSAICVLTAVYYFGINRQMRHKIMSIVKDKIRNINKQI